MRPILVTGAAGYLGRHVLAALRAAGAPVAGTSRRGGDGLAACDLLDQAALARLLREVAPATVVHCAAERVGRYDDTAAASASVAMVENLLTAGATRIVHVSSMTVYAPDIARPAREDVTRPGSAYAEGKLAAEGALMARPDVAATILRLPGLFGAPRAGGLVHALCEAAATGGPVTLPSAPVLWAAMHVADAAAVIARAALQPCDSTAVMNLGYAGVFSINRLLDLLAEETGRRLVTEIAHPDFEMDLTRLHSRYGRAPGSLRARLSEAVLAARRHHDSPILEGRSA